MGGGFDGEEKELPEALSNSGDGLALPSFPGKLARVKSGDEECILRP